MRERVAIAPEAIRPDPRGVLEHQGIPVGIDPGERTRVILGAALEELVECARPAGVFVDITCEEFETVYRGAGRNAGDTPVEGIFPRASHLALFAVTIGPAIGARISELFARREFALASMLDSAASEATENAADVLERAFLAKRPHREGEAPDRLLRYSPGYCGWHVSGQAALFGVLQPADVGIALRESFLMEPLKSMTGVLVAGPAEIHVFRPDYPFCETCRTRSCRQRMRDVRLSAHPSRGS